MYFLWYPIPGQPPQYLGLYVDDFICFSESNEVEKVFGEAFSLKIDIDLNGPMNHFLDLKFTTDLHDNSHITTTILLIPFVSKHI